MNFNLLGYFNFTTTDLIGKTLGKLHH